jgi:hypothetical protein
MARSCCPPDLLAVNSLCQTKDDDIPAEFTVPLCRGHHRQVHRCGDDEAAWWGKGGDDPTIAARALWLTIRWRGGRLTCRLSPQSLQSPVRRTKRTGRGDWRSAALVVVPSKLTVTPHEVACEIVPPAIGTAARFCGLPISWAR